MIDILQNIDSLKTELDALRPLDAEREGRIMQKFRLDWNYHSNHLEGNSLTYGETKALILFGITAQGKPLKDHLEMTGHNEAIKWIEEVVKEERPLTEHFIRQLHELLLKEPYQVDAVTPTGQPTKKWIQIGQYKTSPNNVVTVTGETFYFATPEETPSMMYDLLEWFRAEKEKGELHPLLLAAEFHYKFVRIHPFDDGNGRTARILMNFILLQHGLPPVVIKTEDKQHYFAALRQADAGLLEPFVEYVGENLVRSLDLMVRGAKGESVDEADDVDKEIALLEYKLKFLEKKVEDEKLSKREKKHSEAEKREIIIDNVVIPLFEKFYTQIQKFNDFYLSNNLRFYFTAKVDEDTRPHNEIYTRVRTHLNAESIEDFKNKIKEINTEIPIKLLGLQYQYNNFLYKHLEINTFNFLTQLEVFFEDNFLEIHTISSIPNANKEIERFDYDDFLKEEEMTKITRLFTKAHSAFINQKIEEAQQATTPKG